MILSSENFYNVGRHNSIISNIIHFSDNDPDHFISISKDQELKDWVQVEESQFNEISSGFLERPDYNYLNKIGIYIYSQTFKAVTTISKSILFNNTIAVGYEDGLLLLWKQTVKNKMIKHHLEIIKNLNKKHNIAKPYTNEYCLDLIFPGHKGKILNMIYMKDRNILITSGEDFLIKFWDLNQGISLYHFNLDSGIEFVIYPEFHKTENIFLISNDNHLVKIDIESEPFKFSTNIFNFNKINNYKDNKHIYLFGKQGSLFIFDNMLKFKYELVVEDTSCSGILFLEKWKNYFLIIREDKAVILCNINENKLTILFKIEITSDITTACLLVENTLLIGTRDHKIFYLNVLNEYESYFNRYNMIEEEKLSVMFNNFYSNKLAKIKNKSSAKRKKDPVNTEKKDGKGNNRQSKSAVKKVMKNKGKESKSKDKIVNDINSKKSNSMSKNKKKGGSVLPTIKEKVK